MLPIHQGSKHSSAREHAQLAGQDLDHQVMQTWLEGPPLCRPEIMQPLHLECILKQEPTRLKVRTVLDGNRSGR